MIKGITSSSPFITVLNGSPPSTYVNNYSGAQGIGNMRFNTTTQNIEIWDGNTWMQLAANYATVDLNYDAQSLLEWARKERDRQKHREQLIKNNPALQKAFEAIQRAEANFDILQKFVEDDKEESGVQSSP